MSRAGYVVILLLVLLSGCASHKPSIYTINEQEVFIGWTEQRKLPADAYYALIEGDEEGVNWTVKELYNHPIKGRSNNNQEVLFIDKEFRFVQPFFEYTPTTVVKYDESSQFVTDGKNLRVKENAKYMDIGSWECNNFYKAVKDKYSPCTTRLTKIDVGKSIGKNIFATALTLGYASGSHRVVDKDKIAEILTNTKMFEQIKSSSIYSAASAR